VLSAFDIKPEVTIYVSKCNYSIGPAHFTETLVSQWKKKNNSQITKLRKLAVYEVPFARTNKFRNSFILYALNNYV